MLSRERVRAAMFFRLDRDNRIVLAQVGNQWENRAFRDFYFIEAQVDRAVVQVMKSALYSQTDLPDHKWDELKNQLSLATGIAGAIDSMVNISAHSRSIQELFG